MSLKVITFSQVVAKAHDHEKNHADVDSGYETHAGPLEAGAAEFADSGDYQRLSDRDLASHVGNAIASLQEAMDAAVRAGLMIEPSFKEVSGRFKEFGVSVNSYICAVQIFRKLT